MFQKSVKYSFIINEWIPASKTRNHVINDPVIDWYEYYGRNPKTIIDSLKGKTVWQPQAKLSKIPTPSRRIVDKIPVIDLGKDNKLNHMSAGIQFEAKIIDLLKDKFKKNDFITICDNVSRLKLNALSYESQTLEAMQSGIPLIYQSVLMNWNGKLEKSYGLPDLIVRSDYLDKLVKKDPLISVLRNYRAPNLRGDYHYVIVDIKSRILELSLNDRLIADSNNVSADKCQLCVYNKALGELQGYQPPNAYILARGYKYPNSQPVLDSFELLGIVDYDIDDHHYIDKTIDAIDWIRRMRKHGHNWSLIPKPSVPELYPNPKSIYPNRWNFVKKLHLEKIEGVL